MSTDSDSKSDVTHVTATPDGFWDSVGSPSQEPNPFFLPPWPYVCSPDSIIPPQPVTAADTQDAIVGVRAVTPDGHELTPPHPHTHTGESRAEFGDLG